MKSWQHFPSCLSVTYILTGLKMCIAREKEWYQARCTMVYHPTCQEISCLVVWYWDHFLLLKEVSTQQETSNRADYIRVIIQVTWWYTKVDETSSSSFLLKTYFFKGSLPINLAEIWLGKALLERWIHSRIYGVVIYNKKRQMTATAAEFRRRGWNNPTTTVARKTGSLLKYAGS